MRYVSFSLFAFFSVVFLYSNRVPAQASAGTSGHLKAPKRQLVRSASPLQANQGCSIWQKMDEGDSK